MVEVQLVLANVGETPCRLLASAIRLDLVKNEPFDPERGPEPHDQEGDVRIMPGSQFNIYYSGSRRWGSDGAMTHEFAEPHLGLILYGIFIYEDESTLRVPRRMSFKRRYNLRTSHFYLAETDSPFEYAD
jgi:hypothetical protein